MAYRHERWPRYEEDDDAGQEEASTQTVPRTHEELLAIEDMERTQRLRSMMLDDLGYATRDHITTRDHRENRNEVDISLIEQGRRINQSGTAESNVSPQTVEILSSWSNAHAFLKDDGTADEDLQDLAAGQTHRVKLMGTSHSPELPSLAHSARGDFGGSRKRRPTQARGHSRARGESRGRGDAQLRGSPRNRGGGRGAGGRGGRIMSSPRRASANMRTATELLTIADDPNTRPIVRLAQQASCGQPSGPASNTVRDPPREVSNVRRPASNRSFTLASADDFMAAIRNSPLFRQTASTTTVSPIPIVDLLGGAAEDDPSNMPPVSVEGIQQRPTDTARTEELFNFLEGNNTGASAPPQRVQAETPYGEDLLGLQIAVPTMQPAKGAARAPLEEPASVAATPETSIVKETAEESSQPEHTKGSAQKRITDYFQKAAEMAFERSLVMATRVTSSHPSVTVATKTIQREPSLKETKGTSLREDVLSQGEVAKDKDVTQKKETVWKPSPSNAEQLRGRQDLFAKSIAEDFDITQQIIGESVLSGRDRRGSAASSVSGATAPHSRNPSSISALSVTSTTLAPRTLHAPSAPNISGSRWATRTRSTSTITSRSFQRALALPAHLAGAQRSDDHGAAARAQYGAFRGGVLAPNPTPQAPATNPPTCAGPGSGFAISLPSRGFSSTIRPRPGPSMLNRGGLFGRNDKDDDPKDQPSGSPSLKRLP